jgi:hypothetical protein
VLRPGNAGANSAEVHIRVFHTATAQLPQSFYAGTGPWPGELLPIRTDSAWASRKFLWHLHSLVVQFSISYENRIKTLKTPAWASCRCSFSPRNRPGRTLPPSLSTSCPGSRSPPSRTDRAMAWDVKTPALTALRDRRENHHPQPPQPAHAPGISTGERPPETSSGEHRAPHQRGRSFYRLSRALIPSDEQPITGSGTRAKPGEPTGHTRLPDQKTTTHRPLAHQQNVRSLQKVQIHGDQANMCRSACVTMDLELQHCASHDMPGD